MAAGSQPNGAPTDHKIKRYDRQLRIWGTNGQSALEASQICLLGSGPTGSETLKNLVLGGIGGFTIVDDAVVEARDTGNNFLITAQQIGQCRAAAVSDGLKELNDAVEGSYAELSACKLIDDEPEFFSRFTLVIATQLAESYAVKLDGLCRSSNIPLLLARSYGLAGYVRVSVGEHVVIETKPDNQLDDLRLSQPWPELADYAASIDLQQLDDVHHKHVPYVVLLLQAATQWKANHDNQLPKGSQQQREFKDSIRAMQRVKDGIPMEEENVSEALSNANKLWSASGIPSEVQRVLDDAAARDLSQQSADFWVMTAAMRQFVENEGNGQLPLQGALPDMTATTAAYLELNQLYRRKADADCAAVEAHVHKQLLQLGRGRDEISSKAVRTFCANARNLRVVRYRSLKEEYQGYGGRGAAAVKHLLASEESSSNAALYILLRAADRFKADFRRFPGTDDCDFEEDMVALKSAGSHILTEMGCGSGQLSDDVASEVCRYGAAELHCVGAVLGGIAAQEAIKLLTRQFVPLQDMLVYNAATSTTLLLPASL